MMTSEQELGSEKRRKPPKPALALARQIDSPNVRDRVGAEASSSIRYDSDRDMHEESHQDVRQDQMTEFLGIMRCASCIRDDQKCWIRKSDDACLLCSSTHEPCLFTRTVLKTGPKDEFPWANLTGPKPTAQRKSPRE